MIKEKIYQQDRKLIHVFIKEDGVQLPLKLTNDTFEIHNDALTTKHVVEAGEYELDQFIELFIERTPANEETVVAMAEFVGIDLNEKVEIEEGE